MEPHPHLNITSLLTARNRLRPQMTHDSADLLTYKHSLVSSLPPANYSRVFMNVIDHIYIGILPRSVHTTIWKFLALLLHNNNALTNIAFPGYGRHHTSSACIRIMLEHSHQYTPIFSTR